MCTTLLVNTAISDVFWLNEETFLSDGSERMARKFKRLASKVAPWGCCTAERGECDAMSFSRFAPHQSTSSLSQTGGGGRSERVSNLQFRCRKWVSLTTRIVLRFWMNTLLSRLFYLYTQITKRVHVFKVFIYIRIVSFQINVVQHAAQFLISIRVRKTSLTDAYQKYLKD